MDRFVEVMWLDAVPGDGWVCLDTMPEPRVMRTRGWLVKEVADYIVLAGTLDADNGFYGETIAIPLGMVKSIVHLKTTSDA